MYGFKSPLVSRLADYAVEQPAKEKEHAYPRRTTGFGITLSGTRTSPALCKHRGAKFAIGTSRTRLRPHVVKVQARPVPV